MGPFHFLDGCRKRQLNHAGSVCPLYLILGFFLARYVLFIAASLGCVVFVCVLCPGFLVRLPTWSVPVQVIDWKDSLPKQGR